MLAPCAIDSPGRLRVYKLEEETDADWWEVEALYDLCFAPGRTALSSYRLRDGVPTVAALCLVLRDDDGTLAAAIRYWPVEVAGESESDTVGDLQCFEHAIGASGAMVQDGDPGIRGID